MLIGVQCSEENTTDLNENFDDLFKKSPFFGFQTLKEMGEKSSINGQDLFDQEEKKKLRRIM